MAWASRVNLKGPKGDKGDKGDTGPASTVPGPKGDKGDTPTPSPWISMSYENGHGAQATYLGKTRINSGRLEITIGVAGATLVAGVNNYVAKNDPSHNIAEGRYFLAATNTENVMAWCRLLSGVLTIKVPETVGYVIIDTTLSI